MGEDLQAGCSHAKKGRALCSLCRGDPAGDGESDSWVRSWGSAAPPGAGRTLNTTTARVGATESASTCRAMAAGPSEGPELFQIRNRRKSAEDLKAVRGDKNSAVSQSPGSANTSSRNVQNAPPHTHHERLKAESSRVLPRKCTTPGGS